MIVFQKLRWKNFLSYGNTMTEIDFTKHKTTMISGKNGAGKSTIGEALTFVLFGKPYRNINKPNLVNSINEKECVVEIEFSIGKKQYKVIRGIKPTVFEIYCDGLLVDQSSKNKDYQKYLEQNILKLNYKTFTQLVFLGTSSYVPFMQLTAADRREVIEELLDIRVFSRMNTVGKEKLASIKQAIADADSSIEFAKERITIQKNHLKNLKNRTQQNIDFCNGEIEKTNGEILQNQTLIDSLQKENADLLSSISDAKEVLAKITAFNDGKSKALKQIKQYQDAIKFYSTQNFCSSCNQEISESHKCKIKESNEEKKQELEKSLNELTSKLSKLESRSEEIQNVSTKISANNIEISKIQTQIQGLMKYNQKLSNDIKMMSGDDQQVLDEEQKLATYEKECDDKKIEKDELIDDKSYYELAMLLLKDTGIKTKIIKQYLPIMNKTINKYLTAMDFFVNFNLDEGFKEVIKSRHRDAFEYNSFSEGEKFRIDMSLLLTWRDICRIKNSTNTNILILDEVFDSSLDTSGTDEFIKLLKQLSEKTNIMVITHRPDLLGDKFEHNIIAEKKNNFSVLKQ